MPHHNDASLHYNILDASRRALVPLFVAWKEQFYLAGGTALALWFGHRDSIDFDFFTPNHFAPDVLFRDVQKALAPHSVRIIQEEENTLSIIVDKDIKVSFMTYAPPLLVPPYEDAALRVATIRDIACMKMAAVVGRATMKDYVDIFFILRTYSLGDIIADLTEKVPQLDQLVVLKSLVYFDDVVEEPIRFSPGQEVSFDEVKRAITQTVQEYVAENNLQGRFS